MQSVIGGSAARPRGETCLDSVNLAITETATRQPEHYLENVMNVLNMNEQRSGRPGCAI